MSYSLRPDGTPARLLISGASDGIGAEFARLCAGHPAILVGSRPEGDLQTAPTSGHHYVSLDLAEPEPRAGLLDRVQELMPGGPDLAVLLAGTARIADFPAVDPEEDLRVLEVNTTGAIATAAGLVRRFNPSRVVFVSSIVARATELTYVSYIVSKAALEGAARSLRSEWKGRVSVGVFRPGNTNTRMAEKAAGSPVHSGGRDPRVVARRLYGFAFGGRQQAVDGLVNRVLWRSGPVARLLAG